MIRLVDANAQIRGRIVVEVLEFRGRGVRVQRLEPPAVLVLGVIRCHTVRVPLDIDNADAGRHGDRLRIERHHLSL